MRIYVLAVAVVLVLAAVLVFNVAPTTGTNTSGTPITDCNTFGGGWKFFDAENDPESSNRVWCAPNEGVTDFDNDFGTSPNGNTLFDIGFFDNKVDELRGRAARGCNTKIWLYTGRDQTGTVSIHAVSATLEDNPVTDVFNVQDNIYTSGKILTNC